MINNRRYMMKMEVVLSLMLDCGVQVSVNFSECPHFAVAATNGGKVTDVTIPEGISVWHGDANSTVAFLKRCEGNRQAQAAIEEIEQKLDAILPGIRLVNRISHRHPTELTVYHNADSGTPDYYLSRGKFKKNHKLSTA